MSALPLVDVASERALELPPQPQGDNAPKRTPLALVRPAVRQRRRWPFVLMCVMVVAAVVGTVLVLNVSVSRTQYQLVSLRAELPPGSRMKREVPAAVPPVVVAVVRRG